jgi:16S rRNA (adenine1518-N6/adenine1519-N6)-dimethyltransferase
MSAERHRPRKRFGQHFLRDPGILHRIISAIRPLQAERLVEIGPGLGALTRPLLEATGRLDAIELDRDLIPGLRQRCADLGNLTVHNEDALDFDFARLRTSVERLRVVGNLPYNISTPLLFRLIDQLQHIQDMHFMLQREVVERMAAEPGSGAYGRLSVMIQYRCRVEPLFMIPPGAFNPPPQVHSAFVRLTPHPQLPFLVTDEQRFNELVRQAFSQRRKTLRNSLRGLLTADQIIAAGIDPGTRPEVLSPERFAILSNLIGS